MGNPSFRGVVSLAASSHEDRLTEVLALTLDSDPTLASLFASELSKTALGQRWSVRTQERVREESQRRVDLVLEAESKSHLIWIEVKLDSLEGHEQLDAYYDGLKDRKGPYRKTLVFLTREGGSAARIEELQLTYDPDETGPIEFAAYDWQKLSKLVSNPPRGAGLDQKLNEYLRSEGAIVTPIEHDAIEGLAAYRSGRASLVHLLETISENISTAESNLKAYEKYPKLRSKWENYPFWFRSFELEDAEEAVEAKLVLEWQLGFWDNGEPVPAGPAFIWGLTLVGEDWERSAPGLLDRMSGLEPEFVQFRDGHCDRIVRSMALSAVVGKGSVQQQARFVSDRISRDFEDVRQVFREWIDSLGSDSDDNSLR